MFTSLNPIKSVFVQIFAQKKWPQKKLLLDSNSRSQKVQVELRGIGLGAQGRGSSAAPPQKPQADFETLAGRTTGGRARVLAPTPGSMFAPACLFLFQVERSEKCEKF